MDMRLADEKTDVVYICLAWGLFGGPDTAMIVFGSHFTPNAQFRIALPMRCMKTSRALQSLCGH
eukprot:2719116-Amphidinium_carterae.1